MPDFVLPYMAVLLSAVGKRAWIGGLLGRLSCQAKSVKVWPWVALGRPSLPSRPLKEIRVGGFSVFKAL